MFVILESKPCSIILNNGAGRYLIIIDYKYSLSGKDLEYFQKRSFNFMIGACMK